MLSYPHRMQSLRRTIVRYLMAFLAATTLMWGGCLSCPQFFGPTINAHKSCCNPHGSCKEKPGSQKAARECTIQPAVPTGTKATEASIRSLATVIVPVAIVLIPSRFSLHPDGWHFWLWETPGLRWL